MILFGYAVVPLLILLLIVLPVLYVMGRKKNQVR
jgi:hypothetical protein